MLTRLLLTTTFLALGATTSFAADDVTVTKTPDALEFKIGKETAARYQHAGTVQVEKGETTKPLAKPFFWPLYAPGNVPVTRAWPMKRDNPNDTTDHYHQKSVWFCHGDVIPEGLEIKTKSSNKHVKGANFWDETPGYSSIVCVEVGEPKTLSAGHVVVPTRNEWRTPDGVKILDEVRNIHFVSTPTGRLIAFDIDLHASTYPITFGDTKEGSLGVRVNDVMRTVAKDGGTVTSSSGATAKTPAKDNLPVWGEIAEWHDYSGTVDGKPVGLTVFTDPKNPPAAWHTRAYGLMAANPFGRAGSGFPSQKGKTELLKIAKGDHLKLRFGVFAHTGDAATGKVAETYKAFTEMK